MSKGKAFLIHLAISAVLFLIIAAIIIYYWYPMPFFNTDGGWHGLRIIAAVDLVLGPLLTLIVFKAGKRGLKMDLTIIGMVQAAALAWGIWVVHHERPIAAVYAEKGFYAVSAEVLKIRGLSGDKLRAYGKRTPVWIYANLPESTEQMQKLRSDALRNQHGVQLFTEYYSKLTPENIKKIAMNSLDMDMWLAKKPEYKSTYDRFVKAHQNQMKEIIFTPWVARYTRKIIALDRTSLKYIDTLDIPPPGVEDEKTKSTP